MLIRSGVKFELNPSAEQRAILASYAGTSRFVWNWGLARKQEYYREVVKPAREAGNPVGGLSSVDLINEWNRIKDTVAPGTERLPPR